MTLSNGATTTIVVIAVATAGLMAGLEIGLAFSTSPRSYCLKQPGRACIKLRTAFFEP